MARSHGCRIARFGYPIVFASALTVCASAAIPEGGPLAAPQSSRGGPHPGGSPTHPADPAGPVSLIAPVSEHLSGPGFFREGCENLRSIFSGRGSGS